MVSPQEVLARLENDTLLPTDWLKHLDGDGELESRDGDPVGEAAWLSANGALESAWARPDLPTEAQSRKDEVRRVAFVKVFRVTGHHGLAAQVSDDLGLIVMWATVACPSPLPALLWKAYDNGTVPLLEGGQGVE